MGICYVVCAAAECAPFKKRGEDFVIAADGGLLHLKAMGMEPDLVMGDFDSLGTAPIGDKVLTFPKEKDDTDAMLALKEGWQRGYREFRILAGVGGRTDHTLANLQGLHWVAEKGGRAMLVGKAECFTVVKDGAVRFLPKAEGTVSVFAVGGTACGVDIAGLRYQMQGGTLSPDFPLGVSNAFVGEAATISVQSGALLIVWQGVPKDIENEEV